MFFQQVVNGFVLGSEYALFAVGLALVFGAMRAFNVAYSVTFLIASYVAYVLVSVVKLPMLPVGFLLSILAGALISLLTERIAFWPFRLRGTSDHISEGIASIAFAIVVVNLVQVIFGGDPLAISSPIPSVPLSLGSLVINSIQLLNFGVAVVLMLILGWFLKFTKAGKAIRATAFKATTVRLLGINPERIRMYTFLASGALGGAAGLLMTIFFGSVHAGIAESMMMKVFAIVVIGGVGSLQGSIVAGLLLGVIEALSVTYLSSTFRDVSAYALFFLILLLRPSGLLGKREVNRA
ncbi:MAG: branched-chain amino acid ABC transporter permease [Chloroflexota bacterium]|nr:MAG: branched-chain amino acid ABC transporter permease [Chloroflexota bacterium]